MGYKQSVVQNERYMRPEEVRCLGGDCTMVNHVLAWKTQYSLETLIDEMVEAALAQN